jgi:hypothetical protein
MHFKLSISFHSSLKRYFTASSLEEQSVILTRNPLGGFVIPQLKGARKLRFPDRMRNIGTRGGLRIVYRFMPHRKLIVLYLAYRKTDQSDLLPHQREYILNFSNADLYLEDLWPPENKN